jgi:ribosomal protein S12 methylthiotransferase
VKSKLPAGENLAGNFSIENRMKIHLVSLGCVRNQVDSEMMLGRLQEKGWTITEAPETAEVIVVNTCSFIEAAANESIDTILALAEFKKIGKCRSLIVAGCLPERYREDIAASLPEVDFFLGTGAFDQIETVVTEAGTPKAACILPSPNRTELTTAERPRVISRPYQAYLKIAEGCAGRCTYCIIPKLRGDHRSRAESDIISEARKLIDSGVRELILVAQDTTYYGKDFGSSAGLNNLMRKLSDLSPDIWIRFLYGYPSSFDSALIQTVIERPNICPYFDIPIQHASDRILKRMGRGYNREDLDRLFDLLRNLAPDAFLRTTAIVGFPGETEADIAALLDLMETVKFNHLGVFTYSDAADLPSHRLSGHVSKKVAEARRKLVMNHQQQISTAINEKFHGETLTVLVEETVEESIFLGRHAGQAPEVDGVTYIHLKSNTPKSLSIGDFVSVRIVDTLEYDLVGETVG